MALLVDIKAAITVTAALLGFTLAPHPAAADIRSQAVVNYTFDEVSGPCYDSAATGAARDHGELMGAQRIASPFWEQAGSQAVRFDAAGKQYISVADSPDTDCPGGLSLSFYYLNLHPLDDDVMHGLVAKRAGEDLQSVTNYGINYRPKANVFQVYLNTGEGFRTVAFPVDKVLGHRRRVYLTATYEIADAPGADEDTDADDIRIRLFVNGVPVTPSNVNMGAIEGNDGWLTDINWAATLNDVPLTLGITNSQVEPTSGIVDEFSLFQRPLSSEEAAALFAEVAGPGGAELAKEESQPAPQSTAPSLTALLPRGLTIGASNHITLQGQRLTSEAWLVAPFGELSCSNVKVEGNSMTCEVAVPDDVPPGFYPVSLKTAEGLSNRITLPVDRFTQQLASATSTDAPAQLPAAYSGMLSGDQRGTVYFQGTKGQRLVAEVEAQRLGSKFDPVLEIKDSRGTPLAIEWGKISLSGDPRAEIVLPAEGLYTAEVHDLAFKSPGNQPFRIKVGDLKILDQYFPVAVSPTDTARLQPIGIGLQDPGLVTRQFGGDTDKRAALVTPDLENGPLGPVPAIRLSNAVEIVESEIQVVDAQFDDENKNRPVVFNGRLAAEHEQDRFYLRVTPGQTLSLQLLVDTVNSPLDGQIELFADVNGTRLAVSNEAPVKGNPSMTYKVPDDLDRVLVVVADIHGRGGADFLYRLQIAPTNQPSFTLQVMNSHLQLARQGERPIKLQVDRQNYGGPIRLSIPGDPSVTVSPEILPPGGPNPRLITLSRKPDADATADFANLRIVGESVDLAPAIRTIATVNNDPSEGASPGYEDWLPAATDPAIDASIEITSLPPRLFKGAHASVGIQLKRWGSLDGMPARISILTNERPRQVDDKDPKKGNKPLIRADNEQIIEPGSSGSELDIIVPLDVAESHIDIVVQIELLPHAYSNEVLATIYSKPIHLGIADAISASLAAENVSIVAGSSGPVSGEIGRTDGFTEEVVATVTGLPAGYSASPATIASDATAFEITIETPQEAKADEALDKLGVEFRTRSRNSLIARKPLKIAITAPPGKPAEETKLEDQTEPAQ